MARPKVASPKTARSIRLTNELIEKGEALAKERSFSDISDLIRYLLHREIEEYEKRKNTNPSTE